MVSITYNVIDQTYCDKKSHLFARTIKNKKQKAKGPERNIYLFYVARVLNMTYD